VKILPFQIPKPSNTAVLFQVDKGKLYGEFHQHEELQISLVQKGKGTIIVADTVHHFTAGDVFVIGGQQPHVFRNEDDALLHTIFFSPESFGTAFLDLEEGKGIGDFYAFAKAGFKTSATPDITALFDHLSRAKGIHKLSYFIQLLSILKVATHKPLSSFVYEKKITERDGKKMNAILTYTLSHFREAIQLQSVASVASMSPNAFCKYFKKRTNKTYFTFVTELRIEHACKLLRENPEMPIAIISEASGFLTLSHFNRKFKSLKAVSPREYRATFNSL